MNKGFIQLSVFKKAYVGRLTVVIIVSLIYMLIMFKMYVSFELSSMVKLTWNVFFIFSFTKDQIADERIMPFQWVANEVISFVKTTMPSFDNKLMTLAFLLNNYLYPIYSINYSIKKNTCKRIIKDSKHELYTEEIQKGLI